MSAAIDAAESLKKITDEATADLIKAEEIMVPAKTAKTVASKGAG